MKLKGFFDPEGVRHGGNSRAAFVSVPLAVKTGGNVVMIYKQINTGHLDAAITMPMQFVLIELLRALASPTRSNNLVSCMQKPSNLKSTHFFAISHNKIFTYINC